VFRTDRGQPAAAPDVAALRRLDTAAAELRSAATPLLLVRPLRDGPEPGWVDAMASCVPPLRTLLVEGDPATVKQLRRVLADVAQLVRARESAGARQSKGSPATPPH
jgi:hypothetical protein